ncbi:hypothetical protein [Curvivirga aplysinae]|uniref:hypothetical protein n=1 Tax=Curvivirga aplysinae TaxID=2529852 RepID=UPI0012BC63B2|nr:hypothetical protein [Curvivirga aplysinae]MTI11037.1 hypothetical protein [Curvivirga aplysinae]
MSKRFLSALFFCVILAGCVTKPVYNVTNQTFSYSNSNVTLDDVAEAIMQAGEVRGWVMEKRSSNKIAASLYIRTHVSMVDITFTETEFSIEYVDSKNLKYKNGNIHTNYNRWIRNLEHDIRINLSRLARQN